MARLALGARVPLLETLASRNLMLKLSQLMFSNANIKGLKISSPLTVTQSRRRLNVWPPLKMARLALGARVPLLETLASRNLMLKLSQLMFSNANIKGLKISSPLTVTQSRRRLNVWPPLKMARLALGARVPLLEILASRNLMLKLSQLMFSNANISLTGLWISLIKPENSSDFNRIKFPFASSRNFN
jgi:hypothetical protein